MKIRGIEGLSPGLLKDEIERGARLIAFNWTISVLVMTFKRSSDVYLVRPGQTLFLPNFLCSLVTLVVGWWGIPWGPIYTVQSLWNNLCGGIDLTPELAPQLLRSESKSKLPLEIWRLNEGRRYSFAPAAALGIIGIAIWGIVVGVEFHKSQNMPVAVVNGLDVAYDVEINGVLHSLEPNQVKHLKLPEGAFTVTARLPGRAGENRFEFDTNTERSGRKVVVVNPDAAGIVFEETTYYGPDVATLPEPPQPQLFSGRQYYVLAPPDFFFVPFAESISMSKNFGHEERTRLDVLRGYAVETMASILLTNLDREAMVQYLQVLGGLLPSSEDVLEAAANALEPDEAMAFFAQHLQTEPAIVNWHRYYQEYARRYMPEIDLSLMYQKMANDRPEDGASAYLYGRLLDEPSEAHQWYQRAITATKPCMYAHIGIAWDLIGQGDYSLAFKSLETARKAGEFPTSAAYLESDCLISLGRYSDALASFVASESPRGKTDLSVKSQEMRLAFLAGGPFRAQEVIDSSVRQLPSQMEDEPSDGESGSTIFRHALEQQLAYVNGDVDAMSKSAFSDPSPSDRFVAEICGADLTGAEKALREIPEPSSSLWFILYLEAVRQRHPSAETYWKSAIQALEREPGFHQRLAAHLSGTRPMATDKLLSTPMYLAEKRIVLAAVGAHDPACRRACFARAVKCNVDPGFPHHLISAILGQAGQ